MPATAKSEPAASPKLLLSFAPLDKEFCDQLTAELEKKSGFQFQMFCGPAEAAGETVAAADIILILAMSDLSQQALPELCKFAELASSSGKTAVLVHYRQKIDSQLREHVSSTISPFWPTPDRLAGKCAGLADEMVKYVDGLRSEWVAAQKLQAAAAQWEVAGYPVSLLSNEIAEPPYHPAVKSFMTASRWMKTYARLAEAAQDWNREQRPDRLLIKAGSPDLSWESNSPEHCPEQHAIVTDYVDASRRFIQNQQQKLANERQQLALDAWLAQLDKIRDCFANWQMSPTDDFLLLRNSDVGNVAS